MAERTLPAEVTIPATIAAATKALTGLDKLLTAKGWERAAIVYAFTTAEEGRPKKLTTNGQLLSISEFAALAISGLGSRETVRKYRTYWEEAGGRRTVKPGQTVKLPKDGFPPMRDEKDRATDEKYQVKNGLTSGRLTTEERAESVKPAFTDTKVVEKVVESLNDEELENLDKSIRAARAVRTEHYDAPKSMHAAAVYRDVDRFFAVAAAEIGKAIARIDEAIQAGTKFESEQFEMLAREPEKQLDPQMATYRKMVAMVASHEVDAR